VVTTVPEAGNVHREKQKGNKMNNEGNRDLALRVVLLPRDTNKHGSIFGGIITSHIDLAGAVQAKKSCGSFNFVTVAMDKVVFHKPVFVGDLVSFYTQTIRVGRTSVTIKVEVDATRVESQETVRVTEAEIVFVAVDKDWNPVPISG
jgi:acyl-CoA thioesterase YciA